MTKFYNDGAVWILGDMEIPAGTMIKRNGPDGVMEICRYYDYASSGFQTLASGKYSDFSDANGVPYASLAAFKAATDSFFVKASVQEALNPYAFSKNPNGSLDLRKEGLFIASFSPSGSVFAKSVTTGVGSFHLGNVHSLGSSGNRVTLLNRETKNAGVFVFQTCKQDGTVENSVKRLEFSSLQNVDPAGNFTAGSVAYSGEVAPTEDTVFFYLDVYPTETYKGKLYWTGISNGVEVSAMEMNVDYKAGDRCTVVFEYPFFIKAGQSGTTTLNKEDGTPLQVRAGTSGKAYRKLYYRTYKDIEILDRKNIQAGFEIDADSFIIKHSGKKRAEITPTFSALYGPNGEKAVDIGDIKYSIRNADFNGWLLCNGRAMTTAEWQKVVDAGLDAQWTGLFGSKVLPDMRNYILGMPGNANGINRPQGQKTGSEKHTLQVSELPSHNHTVDPPNANTSSDGAYTGSFSSSGTFVYSVYQTGDGGLLEEGRGNPDRNVTYSTVTGNFSIPNHYHSVNIPAFNSEYTGGGLAHNNMQPTFFAGNYFVYIG